MERWKQDRMALLYQALRSGNYNGATLREFRELAAEAVRPAVAAEVARRMPEIVAHERARRAGMAAGRAAGRAEYARLIARRNTNNKR